MHYCRWFSVTDPNTARALSPGSKRLKCVFLTLYCVMYALGRAHMLQHEEQWHLYCAATQMVLLETAWRDVVMSIPTTLTGLPVSQPNTIKGAKLSVASLIGNTISRSVWAKKKQWCIWSYMYGQVEVFIVFTNKSLTIQVLGKNRTKHRMRNSFLLLSQVIKKNGVLLTALNASFS